MMVIRHSLLSLFIVLMSGQALAQGVPGLLPFQGRLTDVNTGVPINVTSTVNYRIYPPGGICYLYEDTQIVLPNAYGVFTVLLGSAGNSTGPANQFTAVFSNNTTPINDSCGGTYVPAANDWRRIEVVVDGVVMPQMQTIGAAPFALTAQNTVTLNGLPSNHYIQTSANITQAAAESLTDGSDASPLHNHDSTYVRIDGANSFTGNVQTSAGIFTTNGSLGIGTTVTNASIEVDEISPTLRLSSTPAGGGTPEIDLYSGATQRAAIKGSDTTNELTFYTGTTEALKLDAAQNAYLAGSLVVAGTVGMGRYTNAQEVALSTILSGQGAAAAGTMWINTNGPSATVHYWDGTTVQTVVPESLAVNSVSVAGGLTLSGTAANPVLSLTPTGVTSGTYKSVTVDTNGVVTAGTNPTNLNGYGITDAVQNVGGLTTVAAGADAAKGVAGNTGKIYVSTDGLKIYRDNGATWDTIGASKFSDVAGINSVAQGGTGVATIPANGQLLIGNGAGYSVANLVAGTGVTITDSAGGINISAVGTGGTVTNVSSANADIAVTNPTTTPVLTLNSGVGASQIVKLNASAQLPAIDGSLLTGLNFGQVSGTLPIAAGGTNSITALNNNRMMVSSGGKIVEMGALADGQIVVGSSGAAPAAATVGSSNGISLTAGAGTFSIGTNASTLKSNNTLVTRDGTGSFASAGVTMDTAILNGATAGTLSLTAPSSFVSYGLEWPSTEGTPGQVLQSDGSGHMVWWSATGISPVGSALPAGQIWVGNAGGTAAAVTPSTDVAVDNAGSFTVSLTGNNTAKVLGANPGVNQLIVTDGATGATLSSKPISSDNFSQYLLMSGRAGGQAFYGGTAAGNGITIDSTSNAAKGNIVLNPGGGNVGIGVASPSTKLSVNGTLKVSNGGETCTVAADAGMVRYNGGNMEYCDGSSWQILGISGAGISALTGDVTAAGSGSVAATIANSAITDAKVSATAAIARTKIASGTANQVLINDGAGVMSSEAQLATLRGGTGVDGSAAANGKILIGNGAGYSLANVSGTANQVSVANGAGTITLSTPQNIDSTASPTFAGATLTGGSMTSNVANGAAAEAFTMNTSVGYTGTAKLLSLQNHGTEAFSVAQDGSVMIGGSTVLTSGGAWNGGIVPTAKGGSGLDGSAAANGKLLIGNGAGYTLANVSGTANQVSVANGAGTITLSTPQNIDSTASPTFAGATLTGGAVTSSVANGAAAKAFTLNTSVGYTGTAKLLSLQNNGTENFAVGQDGSVTSASGAQTSSVANGAAAKAFTLNTSTGYTGTAKLLSLENNGTENFAVNQDGSVMIGGSTVLSSSGAWSGGIVPAAKGGSGLDGSAAANGKLLIGNGTGYTLANVAGTANQVSVANGAGTITLSTPQNIDSTASPTFAGATLTGGAVTSNVADGAAAKAFTLNTSAPYTTTAKLLSLQNNGTENFAVGQDGSVTTASGAHTSSVANGAAAKAFTFNTSGAYTTTSKLLSLENNGTENFAVGQDGSVMIGGLTVLTSGGAWSGGIVPAAKGGSGLDGSAAANGKLLIGNGTGYTLANVAGTANQVSVANGAGTITLSTPQNIDSTASPTFAGETLTGGAMTSSVANGAAAKAFTMNTSVGYTGTAKLLSLQNNGTENFAVNQDGSVMIGGSTVLSSSGAWSGGIVPAAKGGSGLDGSAAANGKLLIGNGTGYTLANVAGTANQVSVSNGAGTITLSTPQNIDSTASPTFAGATLTGGAVTSSVANGAAAKAFTLNTSAGYTTTAKLLSLQNNGTENFAVVQDGSVLTSSGAQTSSVANGAAAKAFTLNTSTGYTGTAKLLSLENNGTENFAVNQDGSVMIGGSTVLSSSGAWSGGIVPAAKGGSGLDGSAAANGKLLIGNGTGYTLANVAGTANQVSVANGAGTITLSTPQNIDSTASPTFAGETLTGGAMTSNVANGVAAKAFTMNTSGAYTTTAKLLSLQNNGTENFAVVQDGSVLTSSGAQTSSVANGAAAKAFTLNTSGAYTGTAKLLSLQNNGTENFAVNQDGSVMIGGSTVLTSGGAWSGGIVPAAKGGSGLDGSAAANGKLLIGNGTGYTLANVAGTANQVSVANGAGTITLSTPQNIDSTASPTFAGATLTGGAVTSNVANGVAAKAFTLNTSAGYTTTAKLLSLQNNGTENFAVVQDGSVLTSSGTQTSSVANGAAAKAFTLNTSGAYTGTAKLLSLENNGTENFAVNQDGSVMIGGSTVLSSSGAWSGGIVPAAKGGSGLDGSAAANGKLLIGNGTGYTLANVAGTANQVSVANGAGTITLSTPQNIDSTASPTFAGATLTGGAVTSNVANGAAAKAFTLNTSAGYTTTAKLLSLQNNGAENFAVVQDGSILTTSGVQTSSVANGAAAKAFTLNTSGAYTTTSKLLSLENNGTENFAVAQDGSVMIGGLTVLTSGGAWSGGIVPAAKGGSGLDGSAAANGKLLIGNGTGYTLANVAGTANQVSVANGAGTITLSTPQNIDSTASPTFAGATLTGGAVTSNVANGAAAKAFTLNTSAGYTTTAKLLSLQNNSTENFAVVQDGSVLTASGVQTSSVANGAAAKAFTLNTSGAYTTTSKLLSLQNNSTENFAVVQDGSVLTASGVQTSSVANGAAAKAFTLNTSSAYTTTAKLLSLQNNGTENFAVNQDGSVMVGGSTVLTSAGAWSGGIVSAAKGGSGLDGSAAANGKLLIGNGTGYTLANVSGTANQVSVANGAGTITLSTPQNIDSTASPTFAGETLTGGAMTSNVANGAAAKAFTMNTSTGYTTTAKLMSLQNNGTENFAVVQDGSILTTSGVHTSSVANGAAAKAFTFNTSGAYTTTAKLLSLQNNGTENFAVNQDGSVMIGGSTVLTSGGAWTGGIVPAAKGGSGLDGSAAANGKLLIGNGTGYTLANVTGTANQVSVANGAGTITLSTPQNIDSTASPTFVGATLTGGTVTSSVANGAAAKAFTLNTSGAYTTTSKLVSLQNNSAEKFAVVQDGSVTATGLQATGGSIAATDNNIAGPSAAINFGTGNVQVLQSASGAALTLSGMTTGGAYTLIVADTTSHTYTFGGQCSATAFVPANAPTQATKKSIYTIIYTTNVGGGTCFISWVSGL